DGIRDKLVTGVQTCALPISVCCRLDFALSIAEVESGAVKWDLGRPYFVRRGPEGHCVHNDKAGACQIYSERPGVCRGYSCANDRSEERRVGKEWRNRWAQET